MAPKLDIGVKNENIQAARAQAPQFKKVQWWKNRELRQLYLCCSVIMLASATTGYDGSMLDVSLLPSGSRVVQDEKLTEFRVSKSFPPGKNISITPEVLC